MDDPKKDVHSHAKKTSIKVGQSIQFVFGLSKEGKEETLYDK